MVTWKQICQLDDIPRLGTRVVRSVAGNVAVFRNGEDQVFALHDKCPHRGGPLSQGIVAGSVVTCPLHSWKIGLENGEAMAPDKGCAHRFSVKIEGSSVWLQID
ncbi:MAG: nitrite reductase small subunit NirD [Betaproteobacteria bacterium]|nr:nitrite reductase small subunit NirD [Betaproteobacteria bacterium]